MSRLLQSLFCLLIPAAGWAQQPIIPLPDPSSNTTVAVPQQVRRAEPPPATASAQELEERGDTLKEAKLFADGIDYYQAALKKNGPPAPLHNKIGIAELQMLRYDAAKKEFERALKSDKTYAEAFNNLGVAFYSKKSYRNAIRNYEKAIALRGSSASFHSNLGTAYFARKEYERANHEYLRALELDPDIFEHRGMNGVSLQLISAEERARYNYTVAKMYARVGNAERSLLYLRKALEDGYDKIDNVYKDAEFAALRKDPRFTQLMAAKPAAIPQ